MGIKISLQKPHKMFLSTLPIFDVLMMIITPGELAECTRILYGTINGMYESIMTIKEEKTFKDEASQARVSDYFATVS